MFSLKKQLISFSLLSSITLLSACGGGSSDSTPELVLNTETTTTSENTPEAAENNLILVQENTTAVAQFSALNAGDDVVFSLSGNDQALFNIDQEGVLTFINAPDFDAGDTGPYDLTVSVAENGSRNANIDIQVSVSDVNDTPALAAVQTVAPDFSSSQVAYLNALEQTVDDGFYIQDQSDYSINTNDNSLFHLGRFGIDTITKYDVNDPSNEIFTFSTQDNGDSISRNPYTLIFASDTKAYLIRYGSDQVLIVNPEATTAEEFRIGSLDLSSYVPENNTNNTPRPSAGVINNGLLYVAMQRLDDSFASTNTVYVAVFDTATDTEVETNANADDDLLGIPLTGLNPLEDSVQSYADKVYVTTNNAFGATDLTQSAIEEIDTTDFSLRTILDASDINGNTSGFITSAAIVSEQQGYFYSTETLFSPFRQISTLRQFNPTTGDISTIAIAGIEDTNISFIGVDSARFLWVSISDSTNPGIDILDTRTNIQFGARLSTLLNPNDIRFIEESNE